MGPEDSSDDQLALVRTVRGSSTRPHTCTRLPLGELAYYRPEVQEEAPRHLCLCVPPYCGREPGAVEDGRFKFKSARHVSPRSGASPGRRHAASRRKAEFQGTYRGRMGSQAGADSETLYPGQPLELEPSQTGKPRTLVGPHVRLSGQPKPAP